MRRSSGILMPLFSLPSPYGIGTIASGKRFIDFLHDSGQSYWQFLPLGPTGYGNSPYQTYSAFAYNPLFIDPGELMEHGLISEEDEKSARCYACRVEYDALYLQRKSLFKNAFANADKEGISKFLSKNTEIKHYCLFMAIKESLGGIPLKEWPEDIRLRRRSALKQYSAELAEDILYHGFLQMEFLRQWRDLKKYAKQKGISLIGDIPIYVSADSADYWCHKKLFLTDKKGDPKDVAGVPPDYFSETGQLWGNPLYDYDQMRKDGYSWWKKRVKHELSLCDVLRIDHFRGFSEFWAIPAGEDSAINGRWIKGPGMELISQIASMGNKGSFIAEDLGLLSDDAIRLIEDSGFSGMRILEFAFDSLSPADYQPHRYPKNCVAYTGTHDNDTTMGWVGKISPEVRDYAVKYLALNAEEGWHIGMIRALYASNADLVIIPMQDHIGMGSDARINTPSTLGDNWTFLLHERFLTPQLAESIRILTKRYER